MYCVGQLWEDRRIDVLVDEVLDRLFFTCGSAYSSGRFIGRIPMTSVAISKLEFHRSTNLVPGMKSILGWYLNDGPAKL
jgi:hypothetical protein